MLSRTLMNESAKCRSGRVFDRTRATGISGRGGERPSEDGQDEGVADEDNTYMVLPPWIRSAFEVVETEFALHVLIGPFCSPALLCQANQFVQRRTLWQGG